MTTNRRRKERSSIGVKMENDDHPLRITMTEQSSEINLNASGWIREGSIPSWLHRQIISILKCGPIPKHIAIIMDGNRRYAREKHVPRQQGHLKGFDKLTETLEWCLDLGINEVTVYAFSIENFKRSADEVSGLMDLARAKMRKLIEEREKLERHGVCVRVLGNISLLPNDLQDLIASAVSMTSNFNRAYLNICLAYTSREEITGAISTVAEGIASGELQESDVDAGLLEGCMHTHACQPVDLLLRTSGEVRLSDFLLWQSSHSLLSFIGVLWPDFARWDLYAAVVYYQRHCKTLKEIECMHKDMLTSESDSLSKRRKEQFLDRVNERKLAALLARSQS